MSRPKRDKQTFIMYCILNRLNAAHTVKSELYGVAMAGLEKLSWEELEAIRAMITASKDLKD